MCKLVILLAAVCLFKCTIVAAYINCVPVDYGATAKVSVMTPSYIEDMQVDMSDYSNSFVRFFRTDTTQGQNYFCYFSDKDTCAQCTLQLQPEYRESDNDEEESPFRYALGSSERNSQRVRVDRIGGSCNKAFGAYHADFRGNKYIKFDVVVDSWSNGLKQYFVELNRRNTQAVDIGGISKTKTALNSFLVVLKDAIANGVIAASSLATAFLTQSADNGVKVQKFLEKSVESLEDYIVARHMRSSPDKAKMLACVSGQWGMPLIDNFQTVDGQAKIMERLVAKLEHHAQEDSAPRFMQVTAIDKKKLTSFIRFYTGANKNDLFLVSESFTSHMVEKLHSKMKLFKEMADYLSKTKGKSVSGLDEVKKDKSVIDAKFDEDTKEAMRLSLLDLSKI